MKLYTHEQMIQAYDAGFQDFKEGLIGRSYHVVESIKPIELPSDDEIKTEIKDFMFDKNKEIFYNGAKWIKEQILNQNKLTIKTNGKVGLSNPDETTNNKLFIKQNENDENLRFY